MMAEDGVKVIDLLKEKSVVHDHPDSRKMLLLQHKEVERLKRNARYTRVAEYEFGAGAKHRHNKNLDGFHGDEIDE